MRASLGPYARKLKVSVSPLKVRTEQRGQILIAPAVFVRESTWIISNFMKSALPT